MPFNNEPFDMPAGLVGQQMAYFSYGAAIVVGVSRLMMRSISIH